MFSWGYCYYCKESYWFFLDSVLRDALKLLSRQICCPSRELLCECSPQVQPQNALWRMRECVRECAGRVSVLATGWWLRWFNVLLGTLDRLSAAWWDQDGWKAGGSRRALGSFQKSVPQNTPCETIIGLLIHWLEGDVFRIRVQVRLENIWKRKSESWFTYEWQILCNLSKKSIFLILQ